MQLDIFTVWVASATVILLLGLQFLFFWIQDRRSSWLGWWVASFLLGSVGSVCFALREPGQEIIGMGVANALVLTGFGFAWQATRVFYHRAPVWPAVIAVPMVWMGLCAWQPFMESMQFRVVVSSLLMGAFAAASTYELWRGRAEQLPSRGMTMIVYGSFVVMMALRVPLVNVLHFPLGGLPIDSMSMGIFNLGIFAHVMSVTVLMVSMTKERREFEQREFALCDPLTGLLNRRAFLDQAKRMARRRRFSREPLGLLVLDLDHFKNVNDRYGHGMGDRVLKSFADVAMANIRPTDFFYRMGGEEFCCILPDATLEQAFQVAERIRRAFGDDVIDGRGVDIRVTVSVGVASSENMGHDLDAMYGSADAAVYAAKGRGRNMSVVAGSALAMRPVAVGYDEPHAVTRAIG